MPEHKLISGYSLECSVLHERLYKWSQAVILGLLGRRELGWSMGELSQINQTIYCTEALWGSDTGGILWTTFHIAGHFWENIFTTSESSRERHLMTLLWEYGRRRVYRILKIHGSVFCRLLRMLCVGWIAIAPRPIWLANKLTKPSWVVFLQSSCLLSNEQSWNQFTFLMFEKTQVLLYFMDCMFNEQYTQWRNVLRLHLSRSHSLTHALCIFHWSKHCNTKMWSNL